MAAGVVTVNELKILEVEADPRTGVGEDANPGSIALYDRGSFQPFLKTGSGLNAWAPLLSQNEFYNVTATASVSTSSGTPSVISGMTYTPPAGTYLCIMNATTNISGATGSATLALYNGATMSAISSQTISCNIALLGLITVSAFSIGTSVTCADVLTFDGVTALTGRFSCSSGTLTVTNRILHLLRLA